MVVGWEERRQLVKVANLYYMDGWTQEQIAKKVGVSRPIISRILQKARDSKVVEVYIKDENIHTVELEQQFRKAIWIERCNCCIYCRVNT
ncbi:sigma factor-like helix-turn-helix DNA-binding protein [Priestia aryabhattai]